MNVFHHYSQVGSIPIENNISRGWAILLEEYPSLLYLFIETLKSKCNQGCSITFPNGEYSVEFQKNTTDFDYAEKIIGVSLTAAELTNEYALGEVEVKEGYNPITDISIEYDGTVIIIEVKRTGEDCRKQLEEQITRCEQKILENNSDEENSIEKIYVSLVWTDIIGILEKYISASNSHPGRLVADYYSNLIYCFPSWAPTKCLSKLDISDEDRIYKRFEEIKRLYARINDTELLYNRQAIRLDYDYASECNVFLNDVYTHNNRKEKCVVVAIWPSNTGYQFSRLVRRSNSLEFAQKRFSTIKLDHFGDLHLRVEPYIKICHFNHEVLSLFLDEEESDNHLDAVVEFGRKTNGTRKKEGGNVDWKEYFRLLRESGIVSEPKLKKFEENFEDEFVSSNRNYFTSSVGFQVYLYMTYDEAKRIDSGKDGEHGFVELLQEFIIEFDKFIQR